MTYINFPIDNITNPGTTEIPFDKVNMSIKKLDEITRENLRVALRNFFGEYLEEEETEILFEYAGKEIVKKEVEGLHAWLFNKVRTETFEQIEIRKLKIRLKNIEKLNNANKAECLNMLDSAAKLGPKAKILIPQLMELSVKLIYYKNEELLGKLCDVFAKIGKPAAAPLITMLKSKINKKVVMAMTILEHMGEAVVPALCELLKKDMVTAEKTCFVLAKMGKRAKKAVPYLIEMFKKTKNENNFEFMAVIMVALINIGLPAVAEITKLLDDEKNSEGVKILTIYMLGEIAVNNTDARKFVKEKLEKIKRIEINAEKPKVKMLMIVFKAEQNIEDKEWKESIRVLIEKMKKADKENNIALMSDTCKNLIKIGSLSVREVKELLSGKNPVNIRVKAAYILGEIAEKETDALEKALIKAILTVALYEEEKSVNPQREILNELRNAIKKIKDKEQKEKSGDFVNKMLTI